MRISDWSSDVCSSDLLAEGDHRHAAEQLSDEPFLQPIHDSGEHERAPETARAAEARRHPAPSPQRGRCRSLCLMEGQLPWFEALAASIRSAPMSPSNSAHTGSMALTDRKSVV